MRWISNLLVFGTLLLTSGCFFGDYVLRREVTFDQHASMELPGDQFDIDMSRIPASWIDEKTIASKPWGHSVSISLDPDHRVRIIVVPAEPQTRATTEDSES